VIKRKKYCEEDALMKPKAQRQYTYVILFFVIAAVLFSQNYIYQQYQAYQADLSKTKVAEELQAAGTNAYNYVQLLASAEYDGRAPGTQGNRLAAQYIADQFRQIGLKPAGDGGSYFQTIRSPEFTLVLVGDRWMPRLTRGMFLTVPSANVLGYLPSPDATYPGDTIIISCHLDHLGQQGDHYFPGANDNASGVGVMIEVAKILASRQQRPKCNLLFAAWTSEEEGLYGSRWFTEHSPIGGIRAVVNMDSLGNGDPRRFRIWTQSPDSPLIAPITEAAATLGFGVDTEVLTNASGYTGDHRSFAEVGVPAVTLVSPTWLVDNHSVQDTPAIVSPVKLSNAVKLVLATIDKLAY
jgi:acetylornithine deacetylase/succinyl-diaminopimelate desuccinylase-like protein